MSTDRYAHSAPGLPQDRWEPLDEHLSAVGARAGGFARPFGAEHVARAAGQLHDIGKASLAYLNYISGSGANKGPDHSTAGAREAVRLFGPQIGKMLAYAIAGHHAGLADGDGEGGGKSTLKARLAPEYSLEPYSGWEEHVIGLPGRDELNRDRRPVLDPEHPGFSIAFFTRMLFSCLVDADFLATEDFYARVEGREPPSRGGVLAPGHLQRVRAFMNGRPVQDSEVNRLRAEILDHAIAKAPEPPGLFTLTVPTGGGKTLTSLRFALEHAAVHGLRRIIYVIPFTSIIEQTAAVFRDEVGLGDAVLEHHSSFDWDARPPATENDREGEGAAGLGKLRRDTQNWDAPIIVTTGVQFWESLFADRPGRTRKLHNLAGSVIILDEAQTIPVKLLRPCMAALTELTRNYGASVVLCTATQPALRKVDAALPPLRDKPQGFDVDGSRELAPRPRELYRQLKRVEVEWRPEPVEDAEIAARFAEQPQMLTVVNSRAHARALFESIGELDGARHLTTLMCSRHRRQALAQIRADLADGKPVRLVATSLIEAGVDVSFQEVWRAAAGLDSIAQAAGRCNRNGELGPLGIGFGRAVVFEPAESGVPPAIDAFYQAARHVLRAVGDPLQEEAVASYFRELYFLRGYQALDGANLDGTAFSIMDHLHRGRAALDFPFARIAKAFRLIDEVMDPVIIPFDDDAKRALDLLEHVEPPPAGVLRRLQQYVVPVPARIRQELLGSGAAHVIQPERYGDRFVRLDEESQYHHASGLRLDDPFYRSADRNTI